MRVSRSPRRPAKDSSGWNATATCIRDCVLTGLVGKRQPAADAARHCAGLSRRRRAARGNAGVDPPSQAVLDPHARRRAARKERGRADRRPARRIPFRATLNVAPAGNPNWRRVQLSQSVLGVPRWQGVSVSHLFRDDRFCVTVSPVCQESGGFPAWRHVGA